MTAGVTLSSFNELNGDERPAESSGDSFSARRA
jgi:hypothetical protein